MTFAPMLSDAPRRRAPRVLPVLVGGLVLAVSACGGGSTPETTPSVTTASSSGSSSASAPATASASPSTSAPTPDGFTTTEQKTGSWPELGPRVGSGTAVRVGRHEGYDRVVYEFSGTGRPSFDVAYVTETKDSVSGDTVEVPGDAFLAVKVSTVEVPTDTSSRPSAVPAATLEGTVIASAAPIWGGFEGIGEQFIGVKDSQRPFRVTTLENPTRLVVDIAR